MSAIFTGIRKVASTLSTATSRPIYAKAMNGKSHPHIVFVGEDDYLILSDLDWQL
jgi:hypothetical protein